MEHRNARGPRLHRVVIRRLQIGRQRRRNALAIAAPERLPCEIILLEREVARELFEPRAQHVGHRLAARKRIRSEEHTSELQSLMRNSYAVFCLKQKKHTTHIA